MADPDHLDRAFADALGHAMRVQPAVIFSLDWPGLVALVAQLQLALRCDGNVGRSAAAARQFCDLVIARAEAVAPALGPLLRMGFDPACDRERKGGG